MHLDKTPKEICSASAVIKLSTQIKCELYRQAIFSYYMLIVNIYLIPVSQNK